VLNFAAWLSRAIHEPVVLGGGCFKDHGDLVAVHVMVPLASYAAVEQRAATFVGFGSGSGVAQWDRVSGRLSASDDAGCKGRSCG
jgi:hypothetical protein